jgi:hypothetical protein
MISNKYEDNDYNLDLVLLTILDPSNVSYPTRSRSVNKNNHFSPSTLPCSHMILVVRTKMCFRFLMTSCAFHFHFSMKKAPSRLSFTHQGSCWGGGPPPHTHIKFSEEVDSGKGNPLERNPNFLDQTKFFARPPAQLQKKPLPLHH